MVFGKRGIFYDWIMWWFPYLLLVLFLKGVWCLKLVSLHVPNNVKVGDTVHIQCSYDLEGDILYSIKWYRDDVEFYRFVPRDKPPGQFFPLQGVIVDLLKSANGTLILLETDQTTSGNIKCEVSADAPSFQTVSTHRKLIVREYLLSGSVTVVVNHFVMTVAAGLTFAFLW